MTRGWGKKDIKWEKGQDDDQRVREVRNKMGEMDNDQRVWGFRNKMGKKDDD